MSDIFKKIGNTAVIELKNIQQKYNLKSKIFAKLELDNPSGSVKDRTALNLVMSAINDNILKKDSIIVEATSGNIGISLAFIGKELGYKVMIVMPSNMSKERIDLIKSYDAEIILTDASLGMQGAINKVNEILKENDKTVCLHQFDNLNNKFAHYTTGMEIIKQVPNIDIFLTGIGTSGTICGVGETLKKFNSNILIYGVEPQSSPLLTKGHFGSHKIQGIGANFIPSIYNKNVVDKIYTVSDDDAYFYTKELRTVENIFCGISAGANLKAAIEIAKKEENKNIVIIIPDKGDRYYSINI